jgi:hypothetical protein
MLQDNCLIYQSTVQDLKSNLILSEPLLYCCVFIETVFKVPDLGIELSTGLWAYNFQQDFGHTTFNRTLDIQLSTGLWTYNLQQDFGHTTLNRTLGTQLSTGLWACNFQQDRTMGIQLSTGLSAYNFQQDYVCSISLLITFIKFSKP